MTTRLDPQLYKRTGQNPCRAAKTPRRFPDDPRWWPPKHFGSDRSPGPTDNVLGPGRHDSPEPISFASEVARLLRMDGFYYRHLPKKPIAEAVKLGYIRLCHAR